MAAGLAAYLTSFEGTFLFDDRLQILGHRRITTLWPPWEALGRRRPVVDYSMALSHAAFGQHVWGYHAVNLAIHIIAGLTLYGIVRRTVQAMNGQLGAGALHGRDRASPWVALATAVFWVVHPLQTQSVTYLIQRAESLMGMFYLLTVYCVICGAQRVRAADYTGEQASAHGAGGLARTQDATRFLWYGAAIFFCTLGMGTKAVMVTAPVAVLLYDRMFLAGSFMRALRWRRGLYLGLGATWLVLLASGVVKAVVNPSSSRAHVGFGFKGIAPLDYALTQCGVLMHYLRLSLFPRPLCLDYEWEAVRDFAPAVAPGLIIVTLVVASAIAYFRYRSAAAFAGVWFFVILAPTSSIVPIKDPMFEHRMYLPLAAPLIVLVFAGHWMLRRAAARFALRPAVFRGACVLLGVLVTASLGYATLRRNSDYHNEVGMWRDVLAKRPSSARAAENLGTALLGEGKPDESLAILQRAVEMAPRSATARNALGFALIARGRYKDAREQFEKALEIRPTFLRALVNLGNVLADLRQPERAIPYYEKAIRLRPAQTDARLGLANTLLGLGRSGEAINQYRELLRFDPRDASAWGNLGFALLNQAGNDEALRHQAMDALRTALELDPDAVNARNTLGIALLVEGRLDEAIAAFRQVVKRDPRFAGAYQNLAKCLVQKGDLEAAVQHYRIALRLNPDEPSAHYELGSVLERLGDTAGAAEEYTRTLVLQPNHEPARTALEAIQSRK